MISSEVNNHENTSEHGHDNPKNIIPRKDFFEFVSNFFGHRRTGFFNWQFAMVPLPAVWTLATMMSAIFENRAQNRNWNGWY
jgi:hypothetical protein